VTAVGKAKPQAFRLFNGQISFGCYPSIFSLGLNPLRLEWKFNAFVVMALSASPGTKCSNRFGKMEAAVFFS
jgi:hypothetical protein